MKRRSFLGGLAGAAALLVLGLKPPEPKPMQHVVAWKGAPPRDWTHIGRYHFYNLKLSDPSKWVGLTS
jgi:hypothetical protein